ncbi:phage fiber-tail adaptor protein [Streptomyces sp. NPDC055085]
MAASDYLKDPGDVLDYAVDWSLWLAAGETISSSSFVVGAGITMNSSTNSTVKATVWLAGGTQGMAYQVTNTIVTSAARTAVRSFTVRVTAR